MNISKTILNIFSTTMRGELLLKFRVDKAFVHIIYLFAVVWFSIFINLEIENTLLRVEKNSKTLEDLKIYHAQKTGELASFDRISTIKEMLKAEGSELDIPVKPAAHIEK